MDKSTKISLEHFSHGFAKWTGTSHAFWIALIITILWLLTGFIYHFSEGWESSFGVFINVITFLMLFLMQRSQKKELLAIQLKLNEMISTDKKASNKFINIEDKPEAEIEAAREQHKQLQ